jgi:anti-sigma-K factor RskA
MNEHNDSLLVAEYALGLLEQDEATAFEARLRDEPKLRSDYHNWSEHFAALYDGVEEVTPSTALKANIQERLFPESAVTTSDTKLKSSPWFWPVNWVSSLVLATLIGFIFYQSQQELFQAEYIATLQTEDQAVDVVASYDSSQNLLKVATIKGLPAAGRSHELWLIAGDSPPVSLGILSAIKGKSITLPEDLALVVVGSTLAISDEPAGGSPTGSPTGAVLTTAKVIEI